MITLFSSRQVAISILGFDIHWYGLMYLSAFLLAYFLLPRLQRFRNLTLSSQEISDILTWVIVGVIIGGRLGYVLFYNPSYFWQNPLDVFAVWQGGMSSHGGFIGVSLTLSYVLHRKRIHLWSFLDIMVVPVAIGLALGRVGNFINQELYGIQTTLPWGIEIPGVEGLRHPTQIYAVIKDLTIATICYTALRNTMKAGVPFALFLIFYSIFRFTVEHYRYQDYSNTEVLGIEFTRGQVLTIPLFFIGLGVLWFRLSRKSASEHS